jgi:hypothetical protein
MKRTHLVVGSIALSLLGLAVIFQTGCRLKSPSESMLETAVSAEKNSFKEVAAHLDAGGHFYLYLSTEQWLKNISQHVSEGRQLLQSLPMVPESDKANLNKVIDLLTGLLKDSGIEQVSGVGMSSIAREPGFYQSKAILHHYPGQTNGYLWSFFGKSEHPLKMLDLLPETTAFVSFGDVDAPLIWSALQQQIARSGIPEATAWVKAAPDLFAKNTGIPLEKLLASLGDEIGLVFTLDESKKVSIPLGNQGKIEIPEPGLMLVIKVKDDTIFERIETLLKENPMVIRADKEGLKMRTMPLPLPLPIPLRPSLARSGDYLFCATTDSMIEETVAVLRGLKKGLKGTDEFKRLSKGLTLQGNHFCFSSPKFGQTLIQVQKNVLAARAQSNPGEAEVIQKLLNSQTGGFSCMVAGNTPEGWLVTGNGNQPTGPVLIGAAAAAPAGLLAAIAIPNFVRARQGAQMSAIMNNLRMLNGAKEQWALENKKPLGTRVTEEDLKAYLRGGRIQPIVGESYQVNSIGTPPTARTPVSVGAYPAGSEIKLP